VGDPPWVRTQGGRGRPDHGIVPAHVISRRPETVLVDWRLPVGVASILLYLVHQLRAFPSESAAAEAAFRRALRSEA
jgi:hypothetical protein